ncbi:MAG: efflux RND transporter periplasmic adaptor subunit [Syntrophomonadaceae bacterium]|nr:efflux RND transporter periplasmic adaptor subunit [Syntrophomonadaceae bacterium]
MADATGNRKKVFTRRNLIISGVLLLIALVVGLNIYRVMNRDVIKVQTAKVTEQKMVQTVLASGRVMAVDKSVIYSQVTGTVKKIHVKLGQEVQPGQLLMELNIPDGPQRLAQARAALARAESDLAQARAGGKSLELIDAESAYAEAEASYRLAEDRLKRNQVLYREGAISLESLQEIQSQYTAAESRFRKAAALLDAVRASASAALQGLEAAVDSARANLALLESQMGQEGLKAETAGQVLSIGVREGDMIMPNTILVTVGSIDNLEIVAKINEADALYIKTGQNVVITGSAIPDREFTGQITGVGLEAANQIRNEVETSGLPVTVSLPPGTPLRPGYSVDLEITTQVDEKALVIPYEALFEKDDEPCVYVVRDNTAHLQKVETGMYDNFNIQIKGGLKKGDTVVIDPPQDLEEGSRVRIL